MPVDSVDDRLFIVTLASRMHSLTKHWKEGVICLSLALFSVFLHYYLFLAHGAHPLGYDTGFYRRFLIEPIASFPNSPVPGLGKDALLPRIFLDILRGTLLSPDLILYGSYIFLFASLPVIIFLYLKRFLDVRAAFFAAALVALSPVQYNAYWYMLWKNAFGLVLLFAAFICIERRLWLPALAFDVAIAFSHKTTAVLYIATLCVLIIFDRARWKEILMHVALTGACVLLVSFSDVRAALRVPPEAIFLDWHAYIALSVPFFLLVLNGFAGLRSPLLPKTAMAFFIASFLFPIIHSPFYQRVFVYSDIALTIAAGIAFSYALEKIDLKEISTRSFISILAISISLGLLLGTLWDQMRSIHPLMNAAGVTEITEIGRFLPSETFILTTSDEAPWFEGWTNTHVIAPGMLRDTHNLESWMNFWSATSSEQKISFLNDFQKPLYIASIGDFSDLLGSTTIPCLTDVAPHVKRNDCHD